jgi:hypothetical protein
MSLRNFPDLHIHYDYDVDFKNPTEATPGSEEKIQIFCMRRQDGMALTLPDDTNHRPQETACYAKERTALILPTGKSM